MKYLLIALVFLSGCAITKKQKEERAVRKILAIATKNPNAAAIGCSTLFKPTVTIEVRDSIVRGKDSIHEVYIDLTKECEDYKKGVVKDTVLRYKFKTPDTVYRMRLETRPDVAREIVLFNEAEEAKDKAAVLETSLQKAEEKVSSLRSWLSKLGVVLALGVFFIIYKIVK